MQARFGIVVVVCVAALMGGCNKNKNTGTDNGGTRSLSGPPGQVSDSVRLDPSPSSLMYQAIMMAAPSAVPPFKGALTLRPTDCAPSNENAADTALDYTLELPGISATVWAFQALMTKGSKGNIVPALGVPYCEDAEPVFELTKGAVVCSGTRPVAKGPRGRAGAPGTWIAIEIDPSNGHEYYYLCSQDSAHELTVKTSKDDGTILEETLKYATSPNDYFEVKPDGSIVQHAIVAGSMREQQRDKFRVMATDCKKPFSLLELDVVKSLKVIAANQSKAMSKE